MGHFSASSSVFVRRERIPVLKEISFLLQRWECGERGKWGFGRLFSSGWKPRLRAKSVCPFGILPFVGLTHQRKPTARQPVAGGKVSRKPVFFFHPASLRGREIRVFPSVPCLAPVGKILTGPDLTSWQNDILDILPPSFPTAGSAGWNGR